MRTQLLILVAALGLAGSATAAPESTDATAPNQAANWTQRKLVHFSPPPLYVPSNGYLTNTHFISCDQLIDRVEFVLEQLGARPGEFTVDQRGCHTGNGAVKSIDVTFSVLAPVNDAARNYGPPVDAQWQTVELAGADAGLGDCAFLKYATDKILPLFATRNVKLISPAVCAKVGVGLRAQVLKATPVRTTAP